MPEQKMSARVKQAAKDGMEIPPGKHGRTKVLAPDPASYSRLALEETQCPDAKTKN
jgi:hypothetical protein